MVFIIFTNFINNKKYKDTLLELLYLISVNALMFKFTNYPSKLILIIDFFIILLSIYDYFYNTESENKINKYMANNKSKYLVLYALTFNLIVNNLKFNGNYYMYILPLIYLFSLILLLYLFKINIFKFNYKTSIKWLALIILMFLLIKTTTIKPTNDYNNIIDFGVVIILGLIWNFGLEEIIFRGLSFSSLKYYKLSDVQVNIAQSIIFMLTHIGTYDLKTSLLPLLLGYLLGKLYTSSKSLTPSIIFHGLYNFF
jgi:membrane protease YdiL (CAAX protease family)